MYGGDVYNSEDEEEDRSMDFEYHLSPPLPPADPLPYVDLASILDSCYPDVDLPPVDLPQVDPPVDLPPVDPLPQVDPLPPVDLPQVDVPDVIPEVVQSRILVQHPVHPGADIDITMIKAKRHTFDDGEEQWCYGAYDVHQHKWIQVPCSSVDHLRVTDAFGKSSSAVYTSRAQPGRPVKLGTGKRKRCDKLVGTTPILSRRCVADSMSLLISPSEFEKIPLQCDNLRMDLLPAIFANTKVKFSRPAKWGFLRDPSNYNGAIEDLCVNAKLDDRFIIRVTLIDAMTSLHCVAVRNRQICDVATGMGWMPLTAESFTQLNIGAINFGYKVM